MHPSIQMSDDERDAFLADHQTLRVATKSPGGYPHNVPVGYGYYDGKIFFPSDEESQKIANVRNDPRVCCIVDEGDAARDYETLKGVMVQGEANVYGETEHEDVTHDDILRDLFDGEIVGEERYERVDRVVVEVEPHNVVTWDFGKVDM